MSDEEVGESPASAQSVDHTRFVVGLLRSLNRDLRGKVLPELSSDDARERAAFAAEVIDRLAADTEFGVSRPDGQQAEILELVEMIRTSLRSSTSWESGTVPGKPPVTAREQLVQAVRDLSEFENLDGNGIDTDSLWRAIVSEEMARRQSIDKLHSEASPVASDALPPLSAQILASVLADVEPTAEPGLKVDEVRVLAGGRSKTTVFATVAGIPGWPREIVVREDMPSGVVVDTRHGVTRVADEYPIIEAVHHAEIPAPKPLLLADPHRGRPGFMVTERLRGEAPGDWRGFTDPGAADTRSVVEHMAEILGRLHSLPIESIPIKDAADASPEELMQREIDYRWTKWSRSSVEPSPLIESALACLRRECRKGGLGGPAIVHGDFLPHNLLVADGRVTGVLDWEFAHIGDPAEDLAYCRGAVSAVMPWDEFMDIYISSGGSPVDERRLQIFVLAGVVRNSSFSASAARAHLDGVVDDFTTGAIGYFSVPIMEAQIGAQLIAMDSVSTAK